jgi:tetratricopeptide (TPR) repeat protein
MRFGWSSNCLVDWVGSQGAVMLVASNNFVPDFRDILDGNLVDLAHYLFNDAFQSPEQRLYCESLVSYLRAENDNLKVLVQKMAEFPEIQTLTLLRLQIRNSEFNEETVAAVKKLLFKQDWLSAEAAFALGMTYLRFSRNEEAKVFFKEAYNLLKKSGAHKKSMKALLNVVVAESRIDNKRKLVYDYEFVAKKANEVGATEVEGICHQNISKELHLVGAFELALRHSNRAIELQESDAGSLPYFETLLHRCHVLISLGRYREAHADFEKSKLSPHVQIVEARKAIEKILGVETSPQFDYLEPAWKSKLATEPVEALSKMESQFIDLIKARKVNRDEIIQTLYGESIDWDSARNRFKVFLSRFKKRYPNLISEEDSLLFMADENLQNNITSTSGLK